MLKGATPFNTAHCPDLGACTCCKTLIDVVGFLVPVTDTEEGKRHSAGKWYCVGCHERTTRARANAGAKLQLTQVPLVYKKIEALVRVELGAMTPDETALGNVSACKQLFLHARVRLAVR